jgi:adenylylsulfate kinase
MGAVVNPERSMNTFWQATTVTRPQHEQAHGHRAVVLWFTGLSGAGKSTLANAVEAELHQRGCSTLVLDGDNVRHGLCADLGFEVADRQENIRRIGELAKLMNEAGVIALTAFISPFRVDRDRVRALLPEGDFIEIHCEAPLEVCEARDVKGLYARARNGEIADFTGISSPYEPPEAPELVVPTGSEHLGRCVQRVLACLERRGIVRAERPGVSAGLAPGTRFGQGDAVVMQHAANG